MNDATTSLPLRSWAALLSMAALTAPVWASEGRNMPQRVLPAYQQECAACHVAYPPGVLPGVSWQRIMNGLQHHYGTDASLDEASVKQINAWLQANAGTYKRVERTPPPEDRITRSPWFERKHRNLDAAVWKTPSIKSAANCAACHSGADQGRFDDDNLRWPVGLDARYRRYWNND